MAWHNENPTKGLRKPWYESPIVYLGSVIIIASLILWLFISSTNSAGRVTERQPVQPKPPSFYVIERKILVERLGRPDLYYRGRVLSVGAAISPKFAAWVMSPGTTVVYSHVDVVAEVVQDGKVYHVLRDIDCIRMVIKQ